MEYEVELSGNARRELSAILEWLDANAPEHLVGWYENFSERLLSLHIHPERCPQTRDHFISRYVIRHLLFGKKIGVFRIIFTIKKKRVVVLHIRRCAQQPVLEILE